VCEKEGTSIYMLGTQHPTRSPTTTAALYSSGADVDDDDMMDDVENDAVRIACVFDMIQNSPVQDFQILHQVATTLYSPHTVARFFIALREHVTELDMWHNPAPRQTEDGGTVHHGLWHRIIPQHLHITEPGRIDTAGALDFIQQKGVWSEYVAFAHNLTYAVGALDPITARTVIQLLLVGGGGVVM